VTPQQFVSAVIHAPSTVQPDLIAGDGRAARIVRLRDGRRVMLRVARSGEVSAVQRFVRGLSDRSRRNRFFAQERELSPDQLGRVTRSRPTRRARPRG
jgi:hypothetical protein